MTGFRKFLLNFHLCVGLVICLLVFLLGITGAALIFEYQIDRLSNRSLAYTTPHGTTLSLDELEHRVAEAYPGRRIVAIDLSSASPSPDLTYSFNVAGNDFRFLLTSTLDECSESGILHVLWHNASISFIQTSSPGLH